MLNCFYCEFLSCLVSRIGFCGLGMDFRCFHNLFHMNSAKETDNGLNISGGSDEEA